MHNNNVIVIVYKISIIMYDVCASLQAGTSNDITHDVPCMLVVD